MHARDQTDTLILIWDDGRRADVDADMRARVGFEIVERSCDTLILRPARGTGAEQTRPS
jgi:two-component sensor histidine kinase